MEEVIIEIRYSDEDYIRAENFIGKRRNPSGFIIIFGSIFILVFGFFNLFLAYSASSKQEFWKSFLLLFLSFCIFFSIYKILTSYTHMFQKLSLKRFLKKQSEADSFLFSKRLLTFNESGILEKHELGEYLTYWQAFIDIVETNEDYFFFTNTFIRSLPKKALTKEQAEQLKNLINELLKNKTIS